MPHTYVTNTYLRALYERQRSRIGHGRAIGAGKHSIISAIWHILTNGELYREAGVNYFANAPRAASSLNSSVSVTPSRSQEAATA